MPRFAAAQSSGYIIVALALPLAGCGGGSSKPPSTSTSRPGGGLAKAILPRCGTESFGPPSVVPDPSSKGGWIVGYKLPRGARPSPTQTTGATIFERPPTKSPQKLGDGRSLVIAGHRISFVNRKGNTPYSAGWTTAKANYIVSVDGSSPRVLGRLVECLP
jgi:hypothetical protein